MADEKPLDQRAREAEQYSLDLPTPAQPQPHPTDYVAMAHGCIHNCNACKHCDNN